jgi:hypothetical protein
MTLIADELIIAFYFSFSVVFGMSISPSEMTTLMSAKPSIIEIMACKY